MPLNLEIKVKIKSHLKVIQKLKELNAEYCGILNQKDIYFNIKKSLLKLRIENGNESVIFYNREESKSKTRWSNYSFIHLKNNNGESFFSKLFNIETVVEKKRQLYIFDNTRIHLDTVKNLGKFIELETIVTKNKKDAEKRFNFINNYLGLKEFKEIRKSYKNLLEEK